MSSESPSTAGSPAPTAAGSPSTAHGRRGWLIALGAIVVAGLVFGLAYEGAIPGVDGPGGKSGSHPSPPGPVPFSTALLSATRAADLGPGGPWSALAADALNTAGAITVAGPNSSTSFGTSCDFSPSSSSTSLSIGATIGGVGQGTSPFWSFLLRNSSGSFEVVNVVNGSAGVYGTIAGAGCQSGIGLFAALPATVIDSPAAVEKANAAGGSTFLQHHPEANATLAIFGGITVAGFTTPPYWAVAYYACSFAVGTMRSVGSFSAIIDATTGSVLTAGNSTATCPTAISGIGGGGGSPPTGPPKLSGVLSIASSSPGSCSGHGSLQRCSYLFRITAVSGGLRATDLVFNLRNASGQVDNAVVANLTLLDAGGCAIGSFTFAPGLLGTWVAGASGCGSAALTGPLSANESFQLLTAASRTPSLDGQGFTLEAMALASFSGSVRAAIP